MAELHLNIWYVSVPQRLREAWDIRAALYSRLDIVQRLQIITLWGKYESFKQNEQNMKALCVN